MNFAEYQSESKKTAVYPDIGSNFIYPTLGLVGEAGELANKIKKIARDNNGNLTPEILQTIKEEMGDLLWYVAQLSTEFKMELEDVAQGNLDKLQSRMERGALHGSGDNR